MNRRVFLKSAGGVVILAASSSMPNLLALQLPETENGAAFEPWRSWEHDRARGPVALVHSAILSANAFNTQPWLFKVSGTQIQVYADTQRNLGAFDPYLREMFFSLGCAIENLCLAAKASGFRPVLSFSEAKLSPPDQKPSPALAATIQLVSADKKPDELYHAIPHRHTNRNPFDASRPLPADFIRSLSNLGQDEGVKLFLFTQDSDRHTIIDLIWNSSTRFLADPQVQRGTEPWIRPDMKALQQHRDGAYTGDLGTVPYQELMNRGRLHGIVTVRDRYDQAQTIHAGRVWQRAHLLATARQIAARPANGAVEIIDHERRLNLPASTASRLARLTGDGSWQPTFMFYMGYAIVPGQASARRAVADVLL